MMRSDRIHLAKFTSDPDYESILFEDFNDFDFSGDDGIYRFAVDDMDEADEFEDQDLLE